MQPFFWDTLRELQFGGHGLVANLPRFWAFLSGHSWPLESQLDPNPEYILSSVTLLPTVPSERERWFLPPPPTPPTHTHRGLQALTRQCCMLYDGDSAACEHFLSHVVLSARSLCFSGQTSPLEVNIVLLQTRRKRWKRQWEKVRHRWEIHGTSKHRCLAYHCWALRQR